MKSLTGIFLTLLITTVSHAKCPSGMEVVTGGDSEESLDIITELARSGNLMLIMNRDFNWKLNFKDGLAPFQSGHFINTETTSWNNIDKSVGYIGALMKPNAQIDETKNTYFTPVGHQISITGMNRNQRVFHTKNHSVFSQMSFAYLSSTREKTVSVEKTGLEALLKRPLKVERTFLAKNIGSVGREKYVYESETKITKPLVYPFSVCSTSLNTDIAIEALRKLEAPRNKSNFAIIENERNQNFI